MSEQVDLSPGSKDRNELDDYERLLKDSSASEDDKHQIQACIELWFDEYGPILLARMDAAEKAFAAGDFAALGLIADIRAAIGDPTGKLMQDELVKLVAATKAEADAWREWWDGVEMTEREAGYDAIPGMGHSVTEARKVRDELMKGLVTT